MLVTVTVDRPPEPGDYPYQFLTCGTGWKNQVHQHLPDPGSGRISEDLLREIEQVHARYPKSWVRRHSEGVDVELHLQGEGLPVRYVGANLRPDPTTPWRLVGDDQGPDLLVRVSAASARQYVAVRIREAPARRIAKAIEAEKQISIELEKDIAPHPISLDSEAISVCEALQVLAGEIELWLHVTGPQRFAFRSTPQTDAPIDSDGVHDPCLMAGQ